MTKMFTVALIGPDGTGKSTISARLLNTLPIPIKYVYMGINMNASNHVLPTTRLWQKAKRALGRQKDMGGPPDPSATQPIPRGAFKRSARELKSGLWIGNLMAEEWYRQLVTWYYQARGYVVLFDRHFYFDYYKYHVVDGTVERTLSDRVHGFMLHHLYPKPTLVICLDAPAEILFARKREGSVQLLEQRRQQYLQMQNKVENFVTVDTTQPIEDVVGLICTVIMDFHALVNHEAQPLPKSRAE